MRIYKRESRIQEEVELCGRREVVRLLGNLSDSVRSVFSCPEGFQVGGEDAG